MNASPAPKTVGEIESFVDMLIAACEDEKIYRHLEGLLALPDGRRRAELNAWITDLLVAGAPRSLVTAVACLVDDKVAEKAYEVIYKCRRK